MPAELSSLAQPRRAPHQEQDVLDSLPLGLLLLLLLQPAL